MHSRKLAPLLSVPDTHYFEYNEPVILESGKTLSGIRLAYTTCGDLNDTRTNVVWVFHALTANANPVDWWSGLVGKGKTIDTEHYYVICVNMPGSCYGSTEPESYDFPVITIRDMVRCYQLLAAHLGIAQVHLGIGGSMGGQQLLEWAVTSPDFFKNVCVLASNARHSAWGIAFNATQRMALESTSGPEGLEVARAIALLSYRTQHTYRKTQTDFDERIDNFRAESYQRYQGGKLSARFSPLSYWYLSKAMDSHNVGRGRGSVRKALKLITANTLIIALKGDLLFPIAEQLFLAKNIPGARLEVVDSNYGHDGFLIETPAIGKLLNDFLS